MLDKTSYFHNHIYSPSLSCMFCLINEVGREEHFVIINNSPRSSLNKQSTFSKFSEFKPKKIPWQKSFSFQELLYQNLKKNDILKQGKLVLRLDAVLDEKICPAKHAMVKVLWGTMVTKCFK